MNQLVLLSDKDSLQSATNQQTLLLRCLT